LEFQTITQQVQLINAELKEAQNQRKLFMESNEKFQQHLLRVQQEFQQQLMTTMMEKMAEMFARMIGQAPTITGTQEPAPMETEAPEAASRKRALSSSTSPSNQAKSGKPQFMKLTPLPSHKNTTTTTTNNNNNNNNNNTNNKTVKASDAKVDSTTAPDGQKD
jgi:hypothetical protein